MLGLILVINFVTAFNLEVNFVDRKGWQTFLKKRCYLINLHITSDDQEVTSVNGRSKALDCDGLVISEQTVHFLPKGLVNFFPQVTSIDASYSHLKKITKNDLKPFKDLNDLWLSHNDLQELDGDLFEFNPKLKYFDVKSNENLKSIGTALFRGLHLHQAFFRNCGCIDSDFAPIDDMKSVTRELESKCSK